MKIIFFGTSRFAATILNDLKDYRYPIAAVVTQADKKSGRHLKIVDSPVKHEAKKMGVPILQPHDICSQPFLDNLRSFSAEFYVVVAFGTILPKKLLEMPSYCCLNIHASLLPKYRGAAPVHWTIINGDKTTGLTVIRMNERLDAGDIILQKRLAIQPEDDSETLDSKLASMGAGILNNAIELIVSGNARYVVQNEREATFAPKLKKEDGEIDWTMSTQQIINRIRGMKPWPGTYTYLQGRTLKIYLAYSRQANEAEDYKPGEVIVADQKNGLIVKTGDSALQIAELQLEGKKRMPSAVFVRGHKITPRTMLGPR